MERQADSYRWIESDKTKRAEQRGTVIISKNASNRDSILDSD